MVVPAQPACNAFGLDYVFRARGVARSPDQVLCGRVFRDERSLARQRLVEPLLEDASVGPVLGGMLLPDPCVQCNRVQIFEVATGQRPEDNQLTAQDGLSVQRHKSDGSRLIKRIAPACRDTLRGPRAGWTLDPCPESQFF